MTLTVESIKEIALIAAMLEREGKTEEAAVLDRFLDQVVFDSNTNVVESACV